MKGVEIEIKKFGQFDQVLNINAYGSTWGLFSSSYNVSTPIIKVNEDDTVEISDTIVENVYNQLKSKIDPEINKLYLLGHSMGGLVWRTLIKAIYAHNEDSWLWKSDSPTIETLVQLATPNQGSKLANMKAVNFIDKFQSAIFLDLLDYSSKIINSITYKLGISEEESQHLSDTEKPPTQIQQLKPTSDFLRWLNAKPTYVEKIPHYILVGKQNRLLFTNLAWTEIDDDTKLDVNQLKKLEDLEGKSIEEIKKEIDFEDYIDDSDIKEAISDMNANISKDELEEEGENHTSTIMQLFNQTNVEPNDGFVSVDDCKLEGANWVDLGEYAELITHWGICQWYLPFERFKFVKEKVLSILEDEISEEK